MKPLLQFVGLCMIFLVGIALFMVFMGPIKTLTGGPTEAEIEQMVSAQQHQVIMYSLTTCGYCTAKRKEFQERGVKFTEYFLDKDQQAAHQASTKLAMQGFENGNIGTPLFEINGRMITGNPPIEELARHW